jgi:hypothetical protein
MDYCVVCNEPAVGYVRVFRGKRKIAAYAACFEHLAWAWTAQEIGQDWVREALARAFSMPKGWVPRIKISATP